MMRSYVSLASALVVALGVAGALAATADVKVNLTEPIAAYKAYVTEKAGKLETDTEAFVAAVKAGDVEKAKSLYAPTRTSYEAIEPIAELFGELDASIDARVDDFEKGEQDPEFRGFHRIEYLLWKENSTKGLEPFADRLLADVKELKAKIEGLEFPPEAVVGGAAELMEEVAETKVSGEEERYSHTDLWAIQANVDGADKIFVLVKSKIEDPAFVEKVAGNFQQVQDTLAKYKANGGFETYDKLNDGDRKVLSTRVNTLAEDLSTLRGKLGLD